MNFRAHFMLRHAMGDKEPEQRQRGDSEGFLTSAERFVSRRDAVDVGLTSGQLDDGWKTCNRPLLSSDINWAASK